MVKRPVLPYNLHATIDTKTEGRCSIMVSPKTEEWVTREEPHS